jgi:hypothetical protein
MRNLFTDGITGDVEVATIFPRTRGEDADGLVLEENPSAAFANLQIIEECAQ